MKNSFRQHNKTEHEIQEEWKIRLTMAITFIYLKDSIDFDKNQLIHLKSDNTEVMMGSETDEINFLNLFCKNI